MFRIFNRLFGYSREERSPAAPEASEAGLHFDAGSDEYLAFAIGQHDLDEARRLATAAGAVVQTDDMFAASARRGLPADT